MLLLSDETANDFSFGNGHSRFDLDVHLTVNYNCGFKLSGMTGSRQSCPKTSLGGESIYRSGRASISMANFFLVQQDEISTHSLFPVFIKHVFPVPDQPR